MATPYVGEIRMFGGNFAPDGWMFCEGQTVPISENETLFNLIGTTYGGDGQETFKLPDLGGRAPVHMGAGPQLSPRMIGEVGGTEEVTLAAAQAGGHTHALLGSLDPGSSPNPGGAVLATGSNVQVFVASSPDATMPSGTLGPAGGSQPHENRQPYLPIRFIISLYGIYPSQT
ncbi:phage tail protein [Conexibacter arvalis]|uniref:Microcystin-dependent protein n=1 Tax=Conexibacter arvalis TaxID=912552 RepID=A0A840IDX6_9ACTN|nr:tail fiber protein [Conexibacter arvalis]MBB4662972.1 microcystin-dependent protein [Conexibacter arvalis]